ncbi:MAG: glycosyltransferase [Sandaracinaceae bacterium]|nr:glycosyltransferase [Sandaracinaceae bacterium]
MYECAGTRLGEGAVESDGDLDHANMAPGGGWRGRAHRPDGGAGVCQAPRRMRATVVIPTYKRAERLRALLECLTHQEGGALARVVVCDDGSPDHTGEVARSFEGRLPLEYAWQEDLGFRAGQARNLGISRAIGEVVVFVDDDVLVRPDFVAEHVRAHERQGSGKSVALEVPITAHETPWVYVYSCNFSVTRGHEELRFDEGFSGWGMEDTELGYRLYHAGYGIVDTDAARVLHVEDPAPRDPFRCEVRQLPPSYDSYVRNAVYFMDKHPHDEVLRGFVRQDLRWYVQDELGRWVKNGYANDVDAVIALCRQQNAARQIAERTATEGSNEDLRESA